MAMINTIAAGWWSWMSGMFWQVTLLIILITIMDILLRNWAWPQVRYALWLLILVKLIIPPTWSLKTSVISHVQPRIHNQITQRISIPLPEQQSIEKTPAHSAQTQPDIDQNKANVKEPSLTAQQPIHTTAPASLSWQSILMIIWIMGVFAFLSLLIGKIMRLRHWHAQQQEHDIPKWFHELLVETAQHFNLTSLPAIVFHPKAVSPAVYGMFKPVMLLPARYFDNLTKTEAKHVLLHELAHLKRGDLWMNGITLIMQIIYWFNPLMIWARRQMKHVREICCDLTVAEVLREDTPAYRQTLLNTARGLLTETVEPGLGLLGVFEDPFRLVTRLKWLEKATWGQGKKIAASAIVITLLVAVSVMPMAGISPSNNSLSSPNKFDESFQILTVPDYYAVMLPQTGDPAEKGKAAVAECRALFKAQGIKAKGDPFARYFTDSKKTPKDKMYWQIGFKVKKSVSVEPPLELIHVPQSQVAIDGVAGKQTAQDEWDAFINTIQQHGYIPCFPPAVEYYRGEKYGELMDHYTQLEIAVLQPQTDYPGLEIEYKEVEPFKAVVLPMRGAYTQSPKALKKVEKYLKKNNIEISGDAFGEYYWSETLPQNAEWIIGYPVQEAVVVDEPYELRTFKGGTVASATMQAEANIETPWNVFITQLFSNEYLPVGAAQESWDNPFGKTTNIEMRIAVYKPSSDAQKMDSAANADYTGYPSTPGEVIVDMVESVEHYYKQRSSETQQIASGLRAKLEYSNQMLKEALLAQDVESYVKFLMDDVIIDPPTAPAVHGKNEYKKLMEEDIARGTKFRTYNSLIMDCWQCGDDIFEIGMFDYALTTPNNHTPQVGNGNSMTIWQEDEDGLLKIKYSIFTYTSY